MHSLSQQTLEYQTLFGGWGGRQTYKELQIRVTSGKAEFSLRQNSILSWMLCLVYSNFSYIWKASLCQNICSLEEEGVINQFKHLICLFQKNTTTHDVMKTAWAMVWELGGMTVGLFIIDNRQFCTLVHCHSTLPAETKFTIISHISGLNLLQGSKYPQPMIPEK